MNNLSPKEAMEILNAMKVKIEIPKAAVTQNKRNAALDMAINALNCSEIPNNSDTISRQMAVDALRAMQTYKMFAGDDLLLIDQAGAQTELMMLPSIQPEQQWVPCSERLPEVGKGVLLTTTFPTVIIGWLKSDGKWMIYENDGNSFQDYIIAWMPLPEPYQER